MYNFLSEIQKPKMSELWDNKEDESWENASKQIIIGITGSIGSGKTTVAKKVADLLKRCQELSLELRRIAEEKKHLHSI